MKREIKITKVKFLNNQEKIKEAAEIYATAVKKNLERLNKKETPAATGASK
ncbi:hypothetical protein MWH25_05130 [Natroniella acetigena]|uniref:hypothetical protein n=1 Tax=Natroniella acetigena TaxID=52004 RepID=UPI00200B807C|nr:hypothetical protein [Natroniella acetigena]MCK8827130.1 hypothetical protein [Natroniella acetigena]